MIGGVLIHCWRFFGAVILADIFCLSCAFNESWRKNRLGVICIRGLASFFGLRMLFITLGWDILHLTKEAESSLDELGRRFSVSNEDSLIVSLLVIIEIAYAKST